MNVQNVEVRSPVGVADSILVTPDAESAPGVLLMLDANGRRPRIEEMAQEIAAHGVL